MVGREGGMGRTHRYGSSIPAAPPLVLKWQRSKLASED